MALSAFSIMNGDEKFQKQWEFRGREVDENSLSNETTDKRYNKLVTDIALLENDEANYTSQCLRNDHLDSYNTVCKKIEPSKKKNLVQKKSNKKKRSDVPKEMVVFEDLKFFADSLMHELTVARENMFAHMRDEMRKMVPSRSSLEPLKKNKPCPLDGIESIDRNLKSNVSNKFPKAVEEAMKHEKVVNPTTTIKLQEDDSLTPPTGDNMILASDSDQLAPSSYLTLPTVLPKPRFQNYRNGFLSNDHIPVGEPMNNSRSESNFYHRFAEFNPEQGFENFSHISSKSVGFLAHNCIQTTGFPVPLHEGTSYGSNMSSLSYGENSFLNNIKVCPRMTDSMLRFPSEGKSANNISRNVVRRTAGEFEVTRS